MTIGWNVVEGSIAIQGRNISKCREIVIAHSVAAGESISADRGNTIWDCDACKGVAVLESTIADRGNTIWDCDACKGVAVLESTIADRGNTIWDCDACKGVAVVKSISADRGNIFTNGNILQHITIH